MDRPLAAFTVMQIAASRSTKAILREAKMVPLVTRELVAAGLALELAAGGDGVGRGAVAARADGFAVRLGQRSWQNVA